LNTLLQRRLPAGEAIFGLNNIRDKAGLRARAHAKKRWDEFTRVGYGMKAFRLVKISLIQIRYSYGGGEILGKLGSRRAAPKGASQFKELTASLKRCSDTKLEFFRSR